MSMASPRFFQQPVRYLRWASHEKPAIFYSFVVGLIGPAMFLVGPPFRRWAGDDYERDRVPMTYPSKPHPLILALLITIPVN